MPDYFADKADRIIELYRQLEDYIMRDTARRIIQSGKLTPTADRLIWKLEQLGESKQEILKQISKLAGMSAQALRKLLQDAVLTSWTDDAQTWQSVGVTLSNPLTNPEVIRVMDAEYRKSLGELNNLTRTTMDQSQKDLIRLLDEAEMRVSSGMQSYDSAISQVLDEYAGRGVVVTYPTGTVRTLESAVRCCVVTSMNQTSAQVSNQYIKETGTNYVITSAHYGARIKGKGQPDLAGHNLWQGMVFCVEGSEQGYPNLEESTGYRYDPVTGNGTVVNPLGLHGYNCRHSHKPWLKELGNPWRDENGNLIDGNGDNISDQKNKDKYEKQQKQRAIERDIRSTKRKLIVKGQELDDCKPSEQARLQSEYDALARTLGKQNKAYNDFCENNGLQPDYSRNKVSGFGTKESRRANKSMK